MLTTRRRRLFALLATILAGVILAAARPQSFSVRDVTAGDIRSVCIVAQVDAAGALTGLREEWTFEAHTTTGAPLGHVSLAAVLGPPPAQGTSQILELMTSRLPTLNARLDLKYPSSGIPNPLATPDPGRANGGSKP